MANPPESSTIYQNRKSTQKSAHGRCCTRLCSGSSKLGIRLLSVCFPAQPLQCSSKGQRAVCGVCTSSHTVAGMRDMPATWHWDIATEVHLRLKALDCYILLCNVEGREWAEGRERPVEVGEECQENDTLKQQEDRAESWAATICDEEMPHALQTMHPFISLPKRADLPLADRCSNPTPLPSRPVSGTNQANLSSLR